MASIVVLTSPAKGHLYPIVETVLELQSRGHQAVISTLSSELPMLNQLGIDTEPLPPELDAAELLDGDAHSPLMGVAAIADQLFARFDPEFNHLHALIEKYQPDLVLCDLTTVGAQMAAEASGLPWAIWSPTYLPVFSTDGPPPLLGFRPTTGLWGTVRDQILGRVARFTLDTFVGTRGNEVRRRAGLLTLTHIDQQFTQAPLVLNFLGEPLEKRHRDWPSNVEMVGPSVWAPPTPADTRIAAIKEPIVLVTCSTEMQNDGVLAQKALDALADTGMHVVVTTGALEPAILRGNANSTIMKFGPHEQILDKAALVVTHGGMGITMKALARGIPLVVAPFGRDQYDTAERVVGRGVGVRINPHSITVPELHEQIMAAMSHTAMAEEVGVTIDASGSSSRAANHIENLLGVRRLVRRSA